MNLAHKNENKATLFPASDALWERALTRIPAGTQTLSKGPNQFVMGITPKYLKKGKGSHVWDVDGNEYIDSPLALGPILLGYDYAPVSADFLAEVTHGLAPLTVAFTNLSLNATAYAWNFGEKYLLKPEIKWRKWDGDTYEKTDEEYTVSFGWRF